MTAPLAPELATAYVHELSADVRAVAVLSADGTVLAGNASLAPLAGLLGHGAARTADGAVWVARTADRTLVAVAGPGAQLGPTALDAAAAVGADSPLPTVENPARELETALRRAL